MKDYRFIEYSIRSVIDYLDKLVIIEGSWGETYEICGLMRSNDGTLEIINKLHEEHPNKIVVEYRNSKSQLDQRNLLWPHITEDCMILLVDADEVYDEHNMVRIKCLANDFCGTEHCVYSFISQVFINDFEHVSYVQYPRLWTIKHNNTYKFIEPNVILVNNKHFEQKLDTDIRHWHYSYCHSPERFEIKKKERTNKHGYFAWGLDENNKVVREDAKITVYKGKHPDIMQGHKLSKGT